MSTLSIYKSLRENGRLESPKLLQVEITDLCPLNCKQCYKDLENSSEMGYEKFKEIIIESSEIGVKSVMLNGGEPLLHSKIVDLIKLATQHGISCTCFTSGLGIDDKFIKSVSEFLFSTNSMYFSTPYNYLNELNKSNIYLVILVPEFLLDEDVTPYA